MTGTTFRIHGVRPGPIPARHEPCRDLSTQCTALLDKLASLTVVPAQASGLRERQGAARQQRWAPAWESYIPARARGAAQSPAPHFHIAIAVWDTRRRIRWWLSCNRIGSHTAGHSSIGHSRSDSAVPNTRHSDSMHIRRRSTRRSSHTRSSNTSCIPSNIHIHDDDDTPVLPNSGAPERSPRLPPLLLHPARFFETLSNSLKSKRTAKRGNHRSRASLGG